METHIDTVVIGAGMLGAAAAYHLARAGQRVALLEAHEPASGASGASFAWLNAVSKEPEAYHRLNAAGMAEYGALAEELGTDTGVRRTGALQWADSAAEQTAGRERVQRLGARGYRAEWISRAEALSLEPDLNIAEEVSGVAWYPGDGWVDAPRLIRTLVNRALAEGAEVRRGQAVRSLLVEDGRVTGVVTERETVRTDRVVICAGVAATDLLAPLGMAVPVRRVPGLLAITTPPAAPLGRVVYAPGVHLRPDASGGLRLGSDDTDALITEESTPDHLLEVARTLVERAAHAFPPAAGLAVREALRGVRPVPGDGVTVAGPVPGVSGVWAAVTHSGITLGPLLGRLLAEEIVGAPPNPLLKSFRPNRFPAAR